MTGKQILFWGLLFAFIVGGAGIGWVTYRGAGELKTIQVKIDEQNTAWDEIQVERRKLEDSVLEEKQRIAELPDSLKKAANAQAVKSSMSFAKAETVIDTNELRVTKRLEYQQSEKHRVKGEMFGNLAKLGIVEAVLLIILVVVRRKMIK